jgi:hypothetical protein
MTPFLGAWKLSDFREPSPTAIKGSCGRDRVTEEAFSRSECKGAWQLATTTKSLAVTKHKSIRTGAVASE